MSHTHQFWLFPQQGDTVSAKQKSEVCTRTLLELKASTSRRISSALITMPSSLVNSDFSSLYARGLTQHDSILFKNVYRRSQHTLCHRWSRSSFETCNGGFESRYTSCTPRRSQSKTKNDSPSTMTHTHVACRLLSRWGGHHNERRRPPN